MHDFIKDARRSLTKLKGRLEHQDDFEDEKIFQFITALLQVIDIVEAVDNQEQPPGPDQVTEIGEHGLTLIDQLGYQLALHQLDTEKQDVEQLAITLARWVIDHHGELTTIQSVVDGLAYLANSLQDKNALSQLAILMGQVVHACSNAIKHDLDNADPSRPWRVLNINRGIVATRSHDLENMRTVFDELVEAIPLEAAEFFKEGMSEMVRLDYPQPVRQLMQSFYERTKTPSLH